MASCKFNSRSTRIVCTNVDPSACKTIECFYIDLFHDSDDSHISSKIHFLNKIAYATQLNIYWLSYENETMESAEFTIFFVSSQETIDIRFTSIGSIIEPIRSGYGELMENFPITNSRCNRDIWEYFYVFFTYSQDIHRFLSNAQCWNNNSS
jgi:hypothetical protein